MAEDNALTVRNERLLLYGCFISGSGYQRVGPAMPVYEFTPRFLFDSMC